MTMHLVGPALSTIGKKKGKTKFRNAEQAKRAREQEQSWKDLEKKWGVAAEEKRRGRALAAAPYTPPKLNYRGSDEPRIASLPVSMEPCTMTPPKVYTGTKVRGIATMHKSNAVPVFSDEEAVEISRMRRG